MLNIQTPATTPGNLIYSIGDRTYIQRPIVLGQLQILMPLISGLDIRNGSPVELLSLLGDSRAIRALAVILIEEGEELRDAMTAEAIDLRERELAFSMSAGQALEVAEDFLSVNDGSMIIAKLLGAMTTIREQMIAAVDAALSTSSHFSTDSLGETSLDATPSCGE